MTNQLSKTFGGAASGAIAALLLFGSHATACSLPGGTGFRPINLADPSIRLGVPRADARPAQRTSGNAPASVVGLWQVTYSTGGAVIDMAFETFHSDGTETLNDITPPVEGNVCLGVWVQMDNTGYRLTHPSWVFDDNGNLLGTAVFDVSIAMKSADVFTGSYTLTYYDARGVKGDVYTGALTAARVLPNY